MTANVKQMMDYRLIPFENRVYEVLASIKYRSWLIEAKMEPHGG